MSLLVLKRFKGSKFFSNCRYFFNIFFHFFSLTTIRCTFRRASRHVETRLIASPRPRLVETATTNWNIVLYIYKVCGGGGKKDWKKFQKNLVVSEKVATFAPSFWGTTPFRGVAQLVAYNVRDVGVASSSLATPTKCKKPLSKRAVFLFYIFSHLRMIYK